MRKSLKILGILLAVIVSLVILAIILLSTFVSPNRLKPVLTEQVMKYTGRQLVIKGDMSWTLFPYLGVKIEQASLSNPAGFKEKMFAEISHVTVGVKLMPLFHRRIESSGITLDGMQLHLIKDKNGKTNWNFVASPAGTKNVANSPKTDTKRAVMGLAISGLTVTNTAIDYTDEQTKKYYNIKHFALDAKDINLIQPFAIQASFDFAANDPALTGRAALKGNVALNMAAEVYTFRDLNLVANVKQGVRNINFDISGDLLADLNQQTLQWTNFKGKIANLTLSGKFDVSNLQKNPVTKGHLDLSPFDLKETLQQIHQDAPNLQTAKMVKGEVDFTTGAAGVSANGNVSIDTLQVENLMMTHISTKAHLQKGVLDLSPITADVYQGTLSGQTIVNLNGAVPQITLHATLANVQALPLVEDLAGKNQKIKIAGAGNFEMQITTSGAESNAILQNLNGVSQFNFKNGSIVGVDLGYLVDSGYAMLKGHASTATNTNQTNFGTLSGTAVIRSGVITNNDLFSDTPRFAIRGAGTIDLVNQKIDYSLQTVVKQRADQQDNLMNLYGLTLPVLITGNLKDPTIRLDSAAIAKSVAQQQLKKIGNQNFEEIKKQLPGKAGDILNSLLGN